MDPQGLAGSAWPEAAKNNDRLEKVAEAFVKKDPDGDGKADTIGIATRATLYDDFNSGLGSFNLNPIFSAYNAYPGFWIKGADGKPAYGSIQPEMKTALGKLRELYAKGLIDHEMGIRDESASEVITYGKAGIFFGPFGYWPLPVVFKNNPKANWQAYALPLDQGGKYNAKAYNLTRSFIVVRKGYPHPEAVVKISNLLLRDEHNYYDITYFPLQTALAPRDEISYSFKALKEVLAGTKKPEDFADKVEYKLLMNDLKTIKDTKLAPYDRTDITYWNPNGENFIRAYSLLVGGKNLLDPHVRRVNSIFNSRTVTIDRKWSHLFNMEMEGFTQIIMGAAPLDAFDQIVKEWKKQGGDQITSEVANEINQ